VSLLGLRRGLRVLELLAGTVDTGLGFGRLREEFGDLAPSTVSRVLKVLMDEGYVEPGGFGRGYVLGARARDFALRVSGHASTAQRMEVHVERLALESGHSAAYFELAGAGVVLRVKSERPDAFHYAGVGSSPAGPRHCMKLVCMAFAGGDTGGFREGELDILRGSGVLANEDDDQPGLTRIASPVFIGGAGGKFVGALGISSFRRFSAEELKKLSFTVKEIAASAGEALGA
ncbi:MAG: helix-turn-helix domain-containing protein, partial [Victivallales bacterium]|nr:helix-turn-helix domain-containing protein [Victivallales bacterium]